MKPHAPLLLSAALGLVAAVNLTGQEAGPAPAADLAAPGIAG
jgi:hypothetical protein